MINLYYVEKIITPGTNTVLVSVPCAVKKFRLLAGTNASNKVSFRDGDSLVGASADPIRARLSAPTSTSDTLSAEVGEVFLFTKKVFVEATGTGTPITVGVYLTGNPVGP